MISRIVGNGGRRKAVSVPEAAMSLGGAVQASRNRSLVPAAPRAPDEGGAWEHYGPPPRPPHWSAVSFGSEARGQEIRAHSERMSNVPLNAVHAG